MATTDLFKSGQVRDLSLDVEYAGRVVRVDDPRMEGRIGIFIPALSTHLAPDSAEPSPTKRTLTGSVLEKPDTIPFSRSVSEDNYLWVRSGAHPVENGAGGSYRVPKVGTWVRMMFKDGDPNKPFWDAGTPNVEGEAIPGGKVGAAPLSDKSAENWKDPKKKPNLHVMMEDPNGTSVYADHNEGSPALVMQLAGGHSLSLAASEDQTGIQKKTAKGLTDAMDDKTDTITLSSPGELSVCIDDKAGTVTVRAGKTTLVVTKNKGITMTGGGTSVSMDHDGGISVKGTRVNLNP